MELVQEGTDGDAPRPFSPFSLLPDELIGAIATRLRASMVSDGLREPQPTSSLDYLAKVGKRIRRIALAIRWEQCVTVHVDDKMAPLVFAQILRSGHYIKELVVIAKSVRDRLTSEEQLARIVASLAACGNLQSFSMRGVQYRVVGQDGSLAAVLQTLAERASQLEYLRLDPYWTVLRGMDHLAGILQAAIHLKKLEIECMGGQARNSHARQVLPLPPLPVLTELRIPTADFIATATFAGTDACKKLHLAYVRAGDLAHIAQCVGHSLEYLDISSLAETYHQNPPPVLAALRQLKLPHNAVPVCLSPLIDPATPLETLTIY